MRKIGRMVVALTAVAGGAFVAAPAHASTPNLPVYIWSEANSSVLECLDAAAPYGTIGQGTPVQIFQCHGGDNQAWWLMADRTIRPAMNTNLCLDANGSTALHAGTNIQLWPCNGGTNQMWYLEGGGSTWDQIIAYSGYCLDVNGSTGKFPNGTGVDLWNCNGGKNQDWMNSYAVNVS